MSLNALFGGYFCRDFGFPQRFAHSTANIATGIANICTIIIRHSLTGHKIILFFLLHIKLLHLENIIIIMVVVIVIVVVVRQLCLFSLHIIKYS